MQILIREKSKDMNLAICVFTYNHPGTVHHILMSAMEIYKKRGIDVYYFDSSTNDLTQNAVQGYINDGYDNLFYYRFPSDMELIDKVYQSMAGKFFHKEYDYIWPMKDRAMMNETGLCHVEEAMNEENDVIFIAQDECMLYPIEEDKTYDKCGDFYLDWGFLATSLDLTIFRTKGILKTFDGAYEKGLYDYFPHYMILFNELQDGMRVKVLRNEETKMMYSTISKSGWTSVVLKIWADEWVRNNEMLPERYNQYKESVIKQEGLLPALFGNVQSLLNYKRLGGFTIEQLEAVKHNWTRVSDIPYEKAESIALGTYDVEHDLDYLNVKGDELLDVLVRISNMVKAGMLSVDDIPLSDLRTAYMQRLSKKYKVESPEYCVSLEAYDDAARQIKERKENKADVCRMLQFMVVTLIAMGE